jgi:hypothetical protein
MMWGSTVPVRAAIGVAQQLPNNMLTNVVHHRVGNPTESAAPKTHQHRCFKHPCYLYNYLIDYFKISTVELHLYTYYYSRITKL